MTGPVEYLVVGFPDGNVNDDIAPELAKLVDNQTIGILDIVFLAKDAAGDVAVMEFDELDQLAGFGEIDAEVGGLIGPDDISFIGAELDPVHRRKARPGLGSRRPARGGPVGSIARQRAGPQRRLPPRGSPHSGRPGRCRRRRSTRPLLT